MQKFIIIPVANNEANAKNIINIPEKLLATGSYQYLHGKLTDITKYDCFNWLGGAPTEKGVYQVDVHTKDKIIPAYAYIWFAKMKPYRRGLIVANDDVASEHKYAFNKWFENAEHL